MTNKSILDGRKISENKLSSLREKLSTISKTLTLISIVVGDIDGAMKYQTMKQAAAKKVGCSLKIKKLPQNSSKEEIYRQIEDSNSNKAVDGIMIQLPLPKKLHKFQTEIINKISRKKDVDGMRDDSPFIAPVVLAIEDALKRSKFRKGKVVVIGANGFVGKKVVRRLSSLRLDVHGFDQDDKLSLTGFKVVISATGKPELITGSMVQEKFIAIDVGAPKPEFSNSAWEKASFITPVPGGIGPLTIYYLLKNLSGGD